jgi:predicted phosphodiesterase
MKQSDHTRRFFSSKHRNRMNLSVRIRRIQNIRIVPVLLIIMLLASCSGRRESFSFIQLSDPQLGMDGYAHDINSFEQAVKQINASESKVDFVIICGDFVHHASDSSFADFKQISEQLEVPYYVVPGNHDVGLVPNDTTLAYYREHFGEDRYTLHHKGITFIFTNTQLWKSDIGETSDSHDLWFETTLQNVKKNRDVVVAGHYPI